MARTLIIIGAGLIILGLAWPLVQKAGLGRLPGDISVERGNFSFHFPVTTMIMVSVALTESIPFLVETPGMTVTPLSPLSSPPEPVS
ncbi:MAG: DUF2905 domain-containing protein [Nitrospinae bacterium]|nr:DUF2905 domain-containing protein [Nitrospinota bacterium]